MNVYKFWYRKFHFPIVMDNWGRPVGWVYVSRCQNATGNLSFLWRKETMSIYFTLITFAVYEREQNFCPKFGRSPIQWRNIDFERETKPDWHTRQKNNNFDKFPTFHHGFFLLFSRSRCTT